MSFILDALRKSDQQRQRSLSPPPMIAPAASARARQPAMIFYGLIAAALIGMGVLLGAMPRWQATSVTQTPPAPVAAANSAASGFAPAPANVAAPVSGPIPVVPAPAEKARPENPLPSTPLPSPVPRASAPIPADAPAPSSGAMAPSPSSSVPAAAAADARPEAVATTMADLPAALAQEVPKPTILIHSYSATPASRFVFINDRKWREGEFPAPGLKLEQITADGAIFSYRGYRFRRGINP